MNRVSCRKIFLLSGIFLLSTFMLVQLSWGCDEQHKHWRWGNQEKGSGCNGYEKQCYPPLMIQSVDVNIETKKILIHGHNFNNGARPFVTLGGEEIQVTGISPNEIVATLPDLQTLLDTDYRLVVSTGSGDNCQDEYDLTIGAVGPEGPAGPAGANGKNGIDGKDGVDGLPGPAGPAGANGKNGIDGKDGKDGKDGVDGLPGPQGPPALIQLTVRFSPAYTFGNDVIDPTDSVSCPGNYRVTGGGFSASSNITVIESKPLQDTAKNGIGWQVAGTVTGSTPVSGSFLQTWAVCACVDPKGCPPPTITAHPSDQNVYLGEKATFSVTATGTGLTYQWQKQLSGGLFENILGPEATNSSYTTPDTVIEDNGAKFHCVVTNAAGSVTSNDATLTFLSPR